MKFNVAEQDKIYSFTVAQDDAQTFGVDTAITLVNGAAYEGAYEITPTADVQIVPAAGLVMRNDLIINPIPDNYGLITWDGSVITVS